MASTPRHRDSRSRAPLWLVAVAAASAFVFLSFDRIEGGITGWLDHTRPASEAELAARADLPGGLASIARLAREVDDATTRTHAAGTAMHERQAAATGRRAGSSTRPVRRSSRRTPGRAGPATHSRVPAHAGSQSRRPVTAGARGQGSTQAQSRRPAHSQR